MSSVELHDGFLRIVDAGHAADFHLRWLRHNCDLDRHPTTNERLNDSADIPDTLAVDEAVVEDAMLRVRWSFDNRVSRFPLAWLRQHAYAIDRPAPARPPSDVERIVRQMGSDPISRTSGFIDDVLERLDRDGAALIRHSSAAPEAETEAWIAAFESRGLRVIGTHFGRIEDLRTDNTTNQNTDQLGYTDAAIDLHTDQPFLDDPPRYQLLQGIRTADAGGETVLADARAAFAYLRALDREAADRIVSTPVRFHRKQRAFEREVIAPIVTFAGGRFQIRSSYFTTAPYHLPFEEMDAWYRAHDRFVRITRDPRHHYRFRLGAGDVLIYDNHRMLHGRTAFRGPRWVRGVYFDPPLADDFARSG